MEQRRNEGRGEPDIPEETRLPGSGSARIRIRNRTRDLVTHHELGAPSPGARFPFTSHVSGRGGASASSSARLLPRRTEFDSRRGRSRIFALGNRAGRWRWSACFIRDFPFSLPIAFRRFPIVISFLPHRLKKKNDKSDLYWEVLREEGASTSWAWRRPHNTTSAASSREETARKKEGAAAAAAPFEKAISLARPLFSIQYRHSVSRRGRAHTHTCTQRRREKRREPSVLSPSPLPVLSRILLPFRLISISLRDEAPDARGLVFHTRTSRAPGRGYRAEAAGETRGDSTHVLQQPEMQRAHASKPGPQLPHTPFPPHSRDTTAVPSPTDAVRQIFLMAAVTSHCRLAIVHARLHRTFLKPC
ncbi:hypothetical protein PR048_002328 [Dryococelus australis]|uniref:Uncharacterized protein n=1 Tax=Dryococelus australis TaxID=614101 RepID=A0ABQ9IJZ5_9NEOP|nr:hypothetical protein PR048_002328 [Dryococelus australis]